MTARAELKPPDFVPNTAFVQHINCWRRRGQQSASTSASKASVSVKVKVKVVKVKVKVLAFQ